MTKPKEWDIVDCPRCKMPFLYEGKKRCKSCISERKTIKAILSQTGPFTTKQISELTGLSTRYTWEHMNELRLKGHITSHGKRPKITWIRNESLSKD